MDNEKRAGLHVPGEPGIWLLIIGDLLVFTCFFVLFVIYRGEQYDVFVAGQATLNRFYGLINTLFLLTSSLFVALGVHRARTGHLGCQRMFTYAMLCGGAFVGVKALEYGEKIASGIGFGTSDFFMLYFAFTGIHLVHVLIGLGVLAFVRSVSGHEDASSRMVAIEGGATFWHLVDLLWIILFALFYILR